MDVNVSVRPASPADVPSILSLIQELAVFERAPDAVVNTTENLLRDGFGPNPLFYCWVASLDTQIVGMAFCYVRYSTWKGPVLYLEDLVVTQPYRQKGIGGRLFEHCLEFARSGPFYQMSWQVLDWNESAMQFYRKYGASFDGEWVNCSLPTHEPT